MEVVGTSPTRSYSANRQNRIVLNQNVVSETSLPSLCGGVNLN